MKLSRVLNFVGLHTDEEVLILRSELENERSERTRLHARLQLSDEVAIDLTDRLQALEDQSSSELRSIVDWNVALKAANAILETTKNQFVELGDKVAALTTDHVDVVAQMLEMNDDLEAANKRLRGEIQELHEHPPLIRIYRDDSDTPIDVRLGDEAYGSYRTMLSDEQHSLPLDIEPASDPEERIVYEGDCEIALEIVRLSFREKNKWFLSQSSEGAIEISARITDEAFLQRVADRDVTFGHGDMVRARFHTVTHQRGEEKRTEWTLIEVLELIPAPQQLQLMTAGGDA